MVHSVSCMKLEGMRQDKAGGRRQGRETEQEEGGMRHEACGMRHELHLNNVGPSSRAMCRQMPAALGLGAMALHSW
jgi:hypothetical protein